MSAYASLEIVTLVTAHEAGGGGINFALPIRKLRLIGQPLTKDHTELVYSGADLNPRSPVFLFIFFTLLVIIDSHLLSGVEEVFTEEVR